MWVFMSFPMTVLVLAELTTTPLVEMLFDVGCVPIVRRRMLEALERVRRESLAAIAVDCRGLHTDVLEFVLNVRDTRPRVPIIVLRDGPEEVLPEVLEHQDRVFVLDREGCMPQRVKEIITEKTANEQ